MRLATPTAVIAASLGCLFQGLTAQAVAGTVATTATGEPLGGANVMLAGGMGRRAVEFFEQLGIEPVSGASGTVRQAVEKYLGGELSGVAPCAESEAHHAAGHHH